MEKLKVTGKTCKGSIIELMKKSVKLDCGINYWADEGFLVEKSKLKDPKPWMLHVEFFDEKEHVLKQKQINRISKVLNNTSWILDIDEDYLSCQNPFLLDFEVNFGKKLMKSCRDVIDIGNNNIVEGSALKLVSIQLLRKTFSC